MQTILTDIAYGIGIILMGGFIIMFTLGGNGSFDQWEEKYNPNNKGKDLQDS